MELPEVFVADDVGEDDAAAELARRIESLELTAPFVLSSRHGERLGARIEGPRPPERPDSAADQEWASALGSRARRSGADSIVAIGGGRCLDVGKLAAARAGLSLIAVPTQLSHDGICSPVAVVPGDSGRAESVGAVAPRFVFVSLATIAGAPSPSVAAGIGDLLANPLALRDWALATERGHSDVDQRAWDLSVQSFELVEPYLDADPETSSRDAGFLARLADALVMSGMAMIASGTSRPASGGEHEISHAIDELYGGRAHHGAQVALGCVVSVALYGEDTDAFRRRLKILGLPERPADLGLSGDDMVKVLLEAPDTRPGRFTVIEEADLDAVKAAELVARVWPEG